MNRFADGKDSAMAGSITFEPEPVMVENMDEKSVMIVDFKESSAQLKTLLDLEEASLVTKNIEPFFLDGKFSKSIFIFLTILLILNRYFYRCEWQLVFLGGLLCGREQSI